MKVVPELDAIERRRDRRFECEGNAEVVVFERPFLFRGKMRNLSQTGCFIETPVKLKLQPLAEVELRLVARGQQLVSRARVMGFQRKKGVGLRFVDSDTRKEEPFSILMEQLNTAA